LLALYLINLACPRLQADNLHVVVHPDTDGVVGKGLEIESRAHWSGLPRADLKGKHCSRWALVGQRSALLHYHSVVLPDPLFLLSSSSVHSIAECDIEEHPSWGNGETIFAHRLNLSRLKYFLIKGVKDWSFAPRSSIYLIQSASSSFQDSWLQAFNPDAHRAFFSVLSIGPDMKHV
jgi:hypothetical protein